jgi:deazaflavin-dependent oxidoreductase (nitroreductase family)
MGLQAEMGLPPNRAGRLQQLLQRIAATRAGTRLLGAVVVPMDRLVDRLSGGRTTAARALGGFPVVLLTTTGARSGERRSTPINAIPHRGDFALIGTNMGKGFTPAWAHNLRKLPRATLTHAQRDYPVVATEIDGDEYEEVFATAIGVYPGYARYRRDSDHEAPIFVLTAGEEE